MKVELFDNDGRAITVTDIQQIKLLNNEGDPFCAYGENGALIWALNKFEDEENFTKFIIDSKLRVIPEKSLGELGV